MKKLSLVLCFILLAGFMKLRADEGMWLPQLVGEQNYEMMKQMGLKLSPEQIYSINNSSLKDAIPMFGRGCTSEVISDQGLLLTNHHCGYGNLQAHSSLEHDYLTLGFWAQSFEEELPNPGLTARFLVRIEDVSDRINKLLHDGMSEEERNKAIAEESKKIEEETKGTSHYEATVRSFFNGNDFYVLVYETYKDVRLVGAPPSSIGNYGGDTDNWMWPRHTGDFSIFRIYMGKDGGPAEYSKDNVPLKPKHFLPVSLNGVKNGDFAMIMGFPGSTDRYLTSWGVKSAIEKSNPAIVAIRDVKLKIMKEFMDKDDAVRIKYASKYARIANYWKYYIGQTKGLKRLDVYDKKVELEKQFSAWFNSNAEMKKKYGETLKLIEEGYKVMDEFVLSNVYLGEAVLRGPEILSMAGRFNELRNELKSENQEKVEKMVKMLKTSAESFFKDYYEPIDRKIFSAMLSMYAKDIPVSQQPEYFVKLNEKYKGDFRAYTEKVFGSSIFCCPVKLNAFLENPSASKIEKDPAFMLYDAFSTKAKAMREITASAAGKLEKGDRFYTAGLRQMLPGKKFYPDANSTMRLTYGKVMDYYPADAVHYNYFTTLDGVMMKEDPNNEEFIVPDKLKELYNNKDYGQYGENGVMKVAFIANLDITGGNSGSPVLNGNGELIGLAFDGNWEAMSGDIAFEPALQRTISVDIRYVLFIIDKYAGATRLINEMKLVKN